MGLDLYAARRADNRESIDTIRSEFGWADSYREILHIWHFDPRGVVRALEDSGHDDLAGRFYGNLPGARRYHSDEGIADMPADIPDEFLPPVISPDEALALAGDLDAMGDDAYAECIAYLRFWGCRDHPIHCSY